MMCHTHTYSMKNQGKINHFSSSEICILGRQKYPSCENPKKIHVIEEPRFIFPSCSETYSSFLKETRAFICTITFIALTKNGITKCQRFDFLLLISFQLLYFLIVLPMYDTGNYVGKPKNNEVLEKRAK